MKTIDEIISNNHDSEKISAIKIDVDGIDLEVLKGGFDVIKKNRPSIMIEHNANHNKELFLLMREFNYKLFTFVSYVEAPYNVSLKEISNNNDKKYWYTNIVCVPAEYVPINLPTEMIKGNFLFGINKKFILEHFY